MAAPQPATKTNRQRLLSQIHIARKDLGLDDDSYRTMLETETGKRSCADLTLGQLMVVLKRLQVSGWKPKRKSPRSRDRMIDKLRAIWINMARAGMVEDGSETALTAWVRRQTSKINGGVGVDQVEWLERDTKLAITVLESLKKWQRRRLRDWENEDMRLISAEQQRLDRPQVDVIRQLLAAQRIFFWPLFDELGIECPDNALQDRRLLRHE